MRAVGVVLALGCAAGPADPAPEGLRDFVRVTDTPARDVTAHRLCAEAADPDAAPDTTFLDCELETFARASAGGAPDVLRVMAFNLERGLGVDGFLEAIAAGDLPVPDVLLASELDRGCERTGGRDVTRELAEALGMDGAFGVEFVELPRGPEGARSRICEHGNAILSRYPLGNVAHAFHAENVSWYRPPEERDGGEPRLGGRSFVSGDVRLGDRLLRLVSVHFESQPSSWDRVLPAQAAEAAEAGLAPGGPAVVGGDTNIPGYQLDLARGDGEVRDPSAAAFLERGYEDGHAALPVEARATRGAFVIDLIFGHGVGWADAAVCPGEVCDALSDHRAVWVEVGL